VAANAEPAPLRPLSLRASAPVSAAQAVEELRLWKRPPVGERPRVFLNMVCTADGRASVGGRSGPIGNRADREMFHALRAAVDAVLVGAGTVRAEGYHRLVRDEERRRLRRARGLAEEPLACVVSARLALPADIPLLADPAARVVVLTPSSTGVVGTGKRGEPDPGAHGDTGPGDGAPGKAAADRRAVPPEGAAHIEYVRAARDGRLDLPAALAEVRTRWGVRTVLCEGGPHLNGELLAAGLVDEMFLSFAPVLAGGGDPGARAGNADTRDGGVPAAVPRIVEGAELDPPVRLRLAHVWESESNLLLHYEVPG
jgi:riboflavin biosynthesis pyrimidine reductase